mmetsp:Transcript_34374/g.102713  ORF Transcript_34374/g.102713 Transcript_34374/m.102713 type:complete len:238 (-) Transcript_34374:24-737(-)
MGDEEALTAMDVHGPPVHGLDLGPQGAHCLHLFSLDGHMASDQLVGARLARELGWPTDALYLWVRLEELEHDITDRGHALLHLPQLPSGPVHLHLLKRGVLQGLGHGRVGLAQVRQQGIGTRKALLDVDSAVVEGHAVEDQFVGCLRGIVERITVLLPGVQLVGQHFEVGAHHHDRVLAVLLLGDEGRALLPGCVGALVRGRSSGYVLRRLLGGGALCAAHFGVHAPVTLRSRVAGA